MGEHHERSIDGLLFSTDRARLDIDAIHAYLAHESYWVPGIHRELVERAIERSLCFGVYEGTRQLGFARVVTDGAGFAYLCDVFVVDAARGRGIGKRLMEFTFAHPDLQRVRRFILATRDAHGLYAQYGFTPLANPEKFMERYDPDALSR
ncbi:GNAT family N-acetyltransferase [Dokdonella fugitiva]|jgi:GNAT superfamily N-acetyltransferase|uniref:GNAT family N-acetyltransferase n=1 Tax=Dokdonella fugitiva TaxID=328517 RepID=UPI0015FCDF5E|nr:GNAT family N-acetyltransferase [Dokdonella fugitiva]MBA8884873.1 GNAT superfamily N-acetyltransferase [Dokdonella fugitiva]